MRPDSIPTATRTRHPKVDRVCVRCGAAFLAHQCQVNRGGGRYCSAECQRAAHAPREVTCDQCGTRFMAIPSKIESGEGLFCGRPCYLAWRKGKATRGPQNSMPVDERFFGHVLKTEACWLWQKATNEKGYGVFNLKRPDGSWVYELAHRFAWRLATGETLIGDDAILHTCDTPGCCRADDIGVYVVDGVEYPRVGHLFKANRTVNIDDMMAKGRHAAPKQTARRGVDNGNAKLTEDDVRAIRARYAAGGVTQQALAAEYRIAHSLVSHIVTRRAWKHVE